jgi:hypothetical protein
VSHHPGIVFGVVGVFAALIYVGSHGRAPDKGTQVALKPTDDTYLGMRSHDDRPEGTVEVVAPSGDSWALSLYSGGVPYQERGQIAGKPDWSYKYTVHRYPVDLDHDFGAWGGFRVVPTESESGFDVGLRYSPARFVYGTLSPDLLVSPRQAGVGVSVYPPAQSVGYQLQHFGLGLAYMADYRGGDGWVPYFALSTRF